MTNSVPARPGPRNSITDVAGIRVGQAQDWTAMTGVSLVLADDGCTGAVDVRGGAPGTRETDLLSGEMLGVKVHGAVLSGGSALGLDAASAIAAALSARGIGLKFAPDQVPVPILPAAILYDLTNGGDKNWGEQPPYRSLGVQALDALSSHVDLGCYGAGCGAKAGQVKGGIGTASLITEDGFTLGALVAVNSVGSVLVPGSSTFWAAPYAIGDEIGVQAAIMPGAARADFPPDCKIAPKIGANTTIGVIALDADLTVGEAKRIAIMAQDGYARAMRPAHTPFDGDTVFVLATGAIPLTGDRARMVAKLGSAAADIAARAIARGVYAAVSLGNAASYRDTFGIV